MADDSELSEQEKLARAQREELERQKTAKEIEETKNKIKESKKKQDEDYKSSFRGKVLSPSIDDLKSGDFKRIFLLPFILPFRIISFFINYKYFWLFFILIIAFFIWLFIMNLLIGGGISVFGTQFDILLSKTPISAITTPVRTFFEEPVGTVAQYGTFKPPETVEKRKPQGVEIENFHAKKSIHRPELDKIETVANVKIYALEDSPTQVKFSCKKEDPLSTDLFTGGESHEKIIISGELDNSDSVYVFENQDKSVYVQCEFEPSGKIAYDVFGKIDRQKTIQEKITLTAVYENFIVRSRLKVYTLSKSVLNSLESRGSNPFKEFKINDPLISSDRSVISEQLRAGPVLLSLILLDSQPLTNGPSYLLGLELYNDKFGWNGKISNLKSLNIFLPNGFSPAEGRCNEFSYQNDILTLKTEVLRQFAEKEIDQERFFCDFIIDSAVSESLDFSLINAEVKFDYAFEEYTTATISQGLIQSTTKVGEVNA